MGNLSENFNKDQFACKCGQCRNEMRISLTLIGILEDLAAFKKIPLTVTKGYVCGSTQDQADIVKKNYHALGKAVDISVTPEKLIETFRYLETFPEITGLGINIKENFIHIDLRDKEPIKWVYLNNEYAELTPELRNKYGLGDDVLKQSIPAPVTIEVNI